MLSDAILNFWVVGSWRSVKLIYFKGFYLLVTVYLDRGGQGMGFQGAIASRDQVISLCTGNVPSPCHCVPSQSVGADTDSFQVVPSVSLSTYLRTRVAMF